MTYFEAINKLKEIEAKYDTPAIKYKGLPIWLFLRTYFVENMFTEVPKANIKPSVSNVMFILRNVFFYNILALFKKSKVWIFDTSNTRKQVGDKFIHHASGSITEICKESLLFEMPDPLKGHISKEDIKENRIISGSVLIMVSRALALLLKRKKITIEGQEILNAILRECKSDIDVSYYVSFLIAQKKTLDILLRLTCHPKVIFMVCPYTQMGFVWSAHAHNIPVVELQHGVLNENHYAYCPPFHSPIFHPTEICVYGEKEYCFLSQKTNMYVNNVSMTGLYMLDCADKHFSEDVFSAFRSSYEKICVVAGETGRENILASFIDRVASIVPGCMFIYVPRHEEPDLEFKSENVKYMFGSNIYQLLKWCDLHCTMMSTTCLEAHYFHKPSIFYEVDGSSYLYYGNVINEKNGAFYAKTEEEFKEYYDHLFEKEYEYRELFAHDSIARMSEVIRRYLKGHS